MTDTIFLGRIKRGIQFWQPYSIILKILMKKKNSFKKKTNVGNTGVHTHCRTPCIFLQSSLNLLLSQGQGGVACVVDQKNAASNYPA